MRSCPSCSGLVPPHLSACPHCDAAPSRWHRLGRALIGLVGAGAAAMTLAACYGAPAYYDTCIDSDGDGWLPGCYNEDLSCDPEDENCDCNDAAASINPGAFDPGGDNVDRDCDGKDGQRTGSTVIDAGWEGDAWFEDVDAAPPLPPE